MEFKFWSKEGQKYKKIKIVPETDFNIKDFKGILIRVNKELDNLRTDIASYFDNPEDVNLKKPKHDDWETQQKIKRLIDCRKDNLIVQTRLKDMLQDKDFIICECGAKMYKIPLNTPYKKFGNEYLILDARAANGEYTYSCEKCFRGIDEKIYEQKQNLKRQRKKLLEKGYNFVPNDHGLWHWVEHDGPDKKSPELARDGPIHPCTRVFEEVKINGYKKPFIKVTEICKKTGKVTHIM